ncbi:hypothetical protein ACGFIR_30790 [Micromonospora sp. NPDC049051]|uniref:hypothetical protein n=1 Tax=Micromonospora sp. NPDC049051 TaxID=3364264 RepID=UPI003715D55B
MSTHCYIGATSPDNPHLVHARFVLCDGHPAVVLPTLAAIWARHAQHNTRTLIAAILAHDWEYLDPDIAATTRSTCPGQRPVPGVGMTLASKVDPPEPVTVIPLCHAAHLDAEWIYLIDADTGALAVHTSDGLRVATYHLADVLNPGSRERGERLCGPRSTAGAPR